MSKREPPAFARRVSEVSFALLLALIVCRATLADSAPTPPRMTLQLYYSQGSYDPAKRDNGVIRAEITNEGLAPVSVPLGYDGSRTRLVGAASPNSIVLSGRGEAGAAGSHIEIRPGESRTIFELPASEIFFQGGWGHPARWSWGWFRLIPRGVPSMSPIHAGPKSLAWETRVRPEARIWAECDVGKTTFTSAPLTVSVRRFPADEIELVAVCRHARALAPDRLRYVISFVPKTTRRGALTRSEHSFELHDNSGAQHFLAALPLQQRPGQYEWDFGPHTVRLIFTRVRDPETGQTRLILTSYQLESGRPYRPYG